MGLPSTILALHLETFLYMTLQSPNILPPPGPKPDFHAMAEKALATRVENQWFTIPCQTFTIGFEDSENDDGPLRYFAWDNEREPYSVSMPEFEAQARPVCNEEYAEYLVANGIERVPISWSETPTALLEHAATFLNGNASKLVDNGVALKQFVSNHTVKTVYGPVPLAFALDWPLMASYNEVEGYAKWAKARIPTLHEVRSIHEYVETQKTKHQSR